ncbi:MAG TPA: hypothetical protein VGG86_05415, partial [Roseiarcus sp.]
QYDSVTPLCPPTGAGVRSRQGFHCGFLKDGIVGAHPSHLSREPLSLGRCLLNAEANHRDRYNPVGGVAAVGGWRRTTAAEPSEGGIGHHDVPANLPVGNMVAIFAAVKRRLRPSLKNDRTPPRRGDILLR